MEDFFIEAFHYPFCPCIVKAVICLTAWSLSSFVSCCHRLVLVILYSVFSIPDTHRLTALLQQDHKSLKAVDENCLPLPTFGSCSHVLWITGPLPRPTSHKLVISTFSVVSWLYTSADLQSFFQWNASYYIVSHSYLGYWAPMKDRVSSVQS